MRVLLVTHRFPPDGVGGVERYVEALAEELVRCGDDVAVLTRTPTPFPRRPQLRRQVARWPRVYRVVGSGVRLDNPFLHHGRLETLLEDVLAEERPHVVHINHLIGFSPATVAVAQAAGVPVVLSLHDYYIACPLVHLEKISGIACHGPDGGRECAATCFAGTLRSPLRWRLRAQYYRSLPLQADRTVCPPGAVAEYMSAYIPELEPVLLAPGVRPPNSPGTRANDSVGRLRLLIPGTIARHKGADLVLQAIALSGLDADVTIAGRIDDRAFARHLVDLAQAADVRLNILGEYTPSDLDNLFETADFAVFPSRVREAFPLGPRESLIRGVPVVVSRVAGLADAVEDGTNGLSFRAGDTAALAAALGRLRQEPGLIEDLRKGARATVIVGVAEHAAEVRKVYSDVRESRTSA